MRVRGAAARPSAPSASKNELAEERPAARRSQAQQRLLDFLDGLCSRAMLEAYLRDMADTDRSLARQITELLELIRQYGPEAVAGAIEKAAAARAFGADYVANILRQQQCATPATAAASPARSAVE